MSERKGKLIAHLIVDAIEQTAYGPRLFGRLSIYVGQGAGTNEHVIKAPHETIDLFDEHGSQWAQIVFDQITPLEAPSSYAWLTIHGSPPSRDCVLVTDTVSIVQWEDGTDEAPRGGVALPIPALRDRVELAV